MDDDNDTVVGDTVEHPENVNPDPEITPPPVKPADETHDDLREVVNGLSEKVDGLTEMVAGLAAPVEQDSVPTKKPWTHWGSTR